MTLTLDKELEKKLNDFPQVIKRLPDLLRDQIALEEWRARRYSSESNRILQDAYREAEESTLTREAAADDLLKYLGEIGECIRNPDEETD